MIIAPTITITITLDNRTVPPSINCNLSQPIDALSVMRVFAKLIDMFGEQVQKASTLSPITPSLTPGETPTNGS